jgi:hypothetical protein
MLSPTIRAELRRLELHPVNLDVASENRDGIELKGSLLDSWEVPRSIDGKWFLAVLKELPDQAGPRATMDAYCAAHRVALADQA